MITLYETQVHIKPEIINRMEGMGNLKQKVLTYGK